MPRTRAGESLRTAVSAPAVHYDRDGKPATFWGLQASASRKEKALQLTVVNPHVSEPRETALVLRGARVSSATATVLTSSDLHARNTFDQPNALEPQSLKLDLRPGALTVTFPPASVTHLALVLA